MMWHWESQEVIPHLYELPETLAFPMTPSKALCFANDDVGGGIFCQPRECWWTRPSGGWRSLIHSKHMATLPWILISSGPSLFLCSTTAILLLWAVPSAGTDGQDQQPSIQQDQQLLVYISSPLSWNGLLCYAGRFLNFWHSANYLTTIVQVLGLYYNRMVQGICGTFYCVWDTCCCMHYLFLSMLSFYFYNTSYGLMSYV